MVKAPTTQPKGKGKDTPQDKDNISPTSEAENAAAGGTNGFSLPDLAMPF